MAIGVAQVSPRRARWGDGREAAAADYVVANARQGDVDDVLATIDKFAYEESFLINVGDEKGALLDAAVRRANTGLALELGTYCGYGSLRIARAAPSARVYSVEFAAANAEVARRIWAHAGVDDRVTCVVGTIGDGGRTLDTLATDHGFAPGSLDLLFLDHDKNAYLPDLQSILDCGWLHPGLHRGRRQRPHPRRSQVPRIHARSSRANCGTPSNTRRTSSTRRCSPTWCSSRNTSVSATRVRCVWRCAWTASPRNR